MKKKILIGTITFLTFTVSVYALTNSFNFDSRKLTFSTNSKKDNIVNSFKSEYNLSTSISSENEETKKIIIELSKKTTSLLLGDINSKNETSEHYYNRHKEYQELAAYNYFPKDSNSSSGYDESIENYRYVIASELAIPQLFNSFNELGVIYNTYGDIRVTLNGNLAISMILLPNVKIKEENKKNPEKYDLKEENLVIYYYFIKIDDTYRLCYLYGEYGDTVQEYFNELESSESKDTKAISSSYQSSLSTLYNFDKLNSITDDKINQIYNQNINNLVYLSSYYNTSVVNNANGFFIGNGVVITTWNFLEKALIEAQYISVRDSNSNVYEIDGIITANPETDVVLIKLKNKTERTINISSSSELKTEDPLITISSKSGVSYTIQKGIIISNDGYIQSSIPLSNNDEGSPLLNSEGEVVGMNTSKSTNASISMAINSEVLKEAKEKLDNIDFDSIQTISFEKLKEDYYYLKYNNENVINAIPKRIWKKYSKIGDIENNIKLELVKANYDKGVVSLRYKNKISDYISGMQLAASYKEQLVKDGYQEILNSSSKCIYQNKKYQIIIVSEFDYLIVVMVKL